MKTYRPFLICIAVIVLLVGGCGLSLWRAKRQYTLNRALIAAIDDNANKQALDLVNAGADPNTRYIPPPAPSFMLLLDQLLRRSSVPDDSPTAFMFVCAEPFYDPTDGRIIHMPFREDLPLARAMLAHGADCNTADRYEESALHSACLRQYSNVVLLLLEHGANINKQDGGGLTPLGQAISVEDVKMMRLLLDHGANVNIRQINGTTPLIEAASLRDTNMTRLLLDYGANPLAEDNSGNTALHFAVSGAPDITRVRLLLANGADPNRRDKAGFTPISIAQKQHYPQLVALLRGGK